MHHRNRTRPRTALITALALVGLLTGCGSSSSGAHPSGSGPVGPTTGGPTTGGPTTGGPTTGGGPPVTVQVKNFAFTPGQTTVAPGTKVTWQFEDPVGHNVAANDKSFKSKDLSSGGSYSYTFNTDGTYDYICTIHPYMTGSVIVK